MEITYNKRTEIVNTPENDKNQPKWLKESFLRITDELQILDKRRGNKTLKQDVNKPYNMRENVLISIN
ncbi:hypothetical protein WJR50_31500 [Catalinimonas sp. 4WD22]|uniref:hypothetical protein n=1 Tax=Catalinimonas locisalis TaxID=3133978 RepID=UPI0031010458